MYVIIFTNIIPYFPSVILFSFSVAIYHLYDRSDIMINTGCRLHNNEWTERKNVSWYPAIIDYLNQFSVCPYLKYDFLKRTS